MNSPGTNCTLQPVPCKVINHVYGNDKCHYRQAPRNGCVDRKLKEAAARPRRSTACAPCPHELRTQKPRDLLRAGPWDTYHPARFHGRLSASNLARYAALSEGQIGAVHPAVDSAGDYNLDPAIGILSHDIDGRAAMYHGNRPVLNARSAAHIE